MYMVTALAVKTTEVVTTNFTLPTPPGSLHAEVVTTNVMRTSRKLMADDTLLTLLGSLLVVIYTLRYEPDNDPPRTKLC
jgi:hypothetical protein